jgi:hypothetical protein
LSIQRFGQIGRWPVIVLGCALVQTGKICERGDLFSVLLVAAHGAVRKPQREGRVRVNACAFDGETGFGNLGVRLFLYFLLCIVSLSRFSSWRIDHAGEIDHRIVCCLQQCGIFDVQVFAHCDILQFCAGYEFHCAGVRRFPTSTF